MLVLLLALSGARAEGPDDKYVTIYNLIQEGDSLNSGGQFSRALTKYREAQAALVQFQKDYPDWNSKVVNFRLNYLLGTIGTLLPKVPASAEAVPGTATPRPPGASVASPAQPGKPAPPPDWDAQVNNLQNDVRRLQEDKVSLEAKLKEALAAQPAAVDPRELVKADEKIKALLKENDLLKVGLEHEKAKPAAPADTQSLEQTRQALEKASHDLAEQTKKADALEQERNALQVKLAGLSPSSSKGGAVLAARDELEAANRKLAEQTKLADRLAQEKETTLARLKTLEADSEAAAALRAENQLLKKQLADLKAAPGASAPTETGASQLARAQAQIAALESDKEILRREKLDLENQLKRLSAQAAAPAASAAAPRAANAEDANRIKKLEQERDDLKQQLEASARELKSARPTASAAPPATAKVQESKRVKELQRERDDLKQQLEASARELRSARATGSAAPPPATKDEDAKRLKKLQQERDDLQKQLEAATKELNSRRSKTAAARALQMEQQVAALRARLDVFEARQVPYTAEELALFRQPAAKPVQVASRPAAKASKELPPGTMALSVEAKRYFTAREFDKAEDRYLQVLRADQNNVPTLANLAAVELELNHLALAETNILQALAHAPENPSCLLVLGRLRFRQGQHDAALDALSRAAKAEPRNAEAQNYLGLTLSAKGLRGPAETALRKAILLEPGYAEAHNNLAVIYATQKPPLLELARWHYKKVLAAGGAANPDLEKLLEPPKAAEGEK